MKQGSRIGFDHTNVAHKTNMRSYKLRKKIGKKGSSPFRKFEQLMASRAYLSKDVIRRLLSNNLDVKPHNMQKSYAITETQKKKRLEYCKELWRRQVEQELPNIVFTDEKQYTVGTF